MKASGKKMAKVNGVDVENRVTDTGENILSMYINEICKISLLTREEENTCATLAAKGDKAAFNKLVNGNLRFVINVAKRYKGNGLPLSDLISEGNIGLINAVEHYDVSKGFHFISYAVWWIRQAILKAICEKSRMIRLPMNRVGELVRIERARKELRETVTAENEIKEVARMLNMDETLVSDLVSISRDMISLDMPIYRESDTSTLGETIQDESFQSPYEFAERKVMRADIESVLNTLDKKEAAVIRCRYGLEDGAKMSLSEIGDRFNLTKERIRQIEKKALKNLQHPRRKRLLQNYIA
ncbi:MAG: RNA polymerase sigma factor RpoD/SigA [Spirochaetaceae bacterium]|jgi:RNA polymerase primary sigma factor|nr:RNA polymerase sigma factor RpoD/SigA [Spirochaetaceae bacterium]